MGIAKSVLPLIPSLALHTTRKNMQRITYWKKGHYVLEKGIIYILDWKEGHYILKKGLWRVPLM